MNLALAIALLFLGCCLTWVAVHGTEATTPWGVFQEITGGLSGTRAAGEGVGGVLAGVGDAVSGREESATIDPSAGRTNEPIGPSE